MLALLVQIGAPSLPRSNADVDRQVGLFLSAFTIGFLVAVLGHVVRSRTLQIVGIMLVFAGTGIFMAASLVHN